MKELRQIQEAVEKLPRQEFWKLAKWFDQRKENVWDREIEEDFRTGGPLDKLARKAMEEHKAGLTVAIEDVFGHPCKPSRKPGASRRKG